MSEQSRAGMLRQLPPARAVDVLLDFFIRYSQNSDPRRAETTRDELIDVHEDLQHLLMDLPFSGMPAMQSFVANPTPHTAQAARMALWAMIDADEESRATVETEKATSPSEPDAELRAFAQDLTAPQGKLLLALIDRPFVWKAEISMIAGISDTHDSVKQLIGNVRKNLKRGGWTCQIRTNGHGQYRLDRK